MSEIKDILYFINRGLAFLTLNKITDAEIDFKRAKLLLEAAQIVLSIPEETQFQQQGE